MQRELSTFPLPPLIRMKLTQAGFSTVEDLKDVKPIEFSKELNISRDEALEILHLVHGQDEVQAKQPNSQTALEMLHDIHHQQHIITFSKMLDDLLDGGIPVTKITEICGAPGVGKTQLSMQLCIDVQIPECFGGLDGEAVYIDTEGSFVVERLYDMAKAAVQHCCCIATSEKNQDQLEALKTFTVERLLSQIYHFHCHDYVELLAVVHTLHDFLKDHKQVKLIVVDSIAFHFRHCFPDYSLRTRLLNGMSQSFIKMASLNKLAVVLTNQMSTKIDSCQLGQSYLIPALGESWSHVCTVRLMLHWKGNVRYATLYKSSSRKEATVSYQITTGGIRDVENSKEEVKETGRSDVCPRKRCRTEDD